MSEKKEVAIRVNDIHKTFILPQHRNTSFKQVTVNIVKRNNKTTQKVLDGVSLDIYKGEFFGIVGRNGSGKSTLLKLIAGVYSPTSGSVEVNGGLTPFIELGVGFNPELSGRDNVYLNGALLGFTRKQMEGMYQDIVDFAELEPFMDQKLKNYSSGMQVRLAFSIAVKAKNDILIFDEVLAVGDEAFQKKCMDIFEDYRRNNQTVVLVTHSMENVRRLCTRALMLADGKIETIGSVKDVARAYVQSNRAIDEGPDPEPVSVGKEKILKVAGYEQTYYPGETMSLHISWPRGSKIRNVGVALWGKQNEFVFGSNTNEVDENSTGADYSVELNLGPGKYYIVVGANDENGKLIERIERVAGFSIYDDFKTTVNGLTRLKHEFTILK